MWPQNRVESVLLLRKNNYERLGVPNNRAYSSNNAVVYARSHVAVNKGRAIAGCLERSNAR